MGSLSSDVVTPKAASARFLTSGSVNPDSEEDSFRGLRRLGLLPGVATLLILTVSFLRGTFFFLRCSSSSSSSSHSSSPSSSSSSSSLDVGFDFFLRLFAGLDSC
jgi:hypothetical protein